MLLKATCCAGRPNRCAADSRTNRHPGCRTTRNAGPRRAHGRQTLSRIRWIALWPEPLLPHGSVRRPHCGPCRALLRAARYLTGPLCQFPIHASGSPSVDALSCAPLWHAQETTAGATRHEGCRAGPLREMLFRTCARSLFWSCVYSCPSTPGRRELHQPARCGKVTSLR